MSEQPLPRWQIPLLLLVLGVTLATLGGSDFAGDLLGFCIAALLLAIAVPELRRRGRTGAAAVAAGAAVVVVVATIAVLATR